MLILPYLRLKNQFFLIFFRKKEGRNFVQTPVNMGFTPLTHVYELVFYDNRSTFRLNQSAKVFK